jgi:hypothetical protein
VGFCYDAESRIILDPDEEVRGAVSLVFRLFRETGSAFAVMQRFAARTLRFPTRSYGGAWDGKLIWGRLTHGRVLGLLKNPSYAGRYVFGRYQYRREISPEGTVHPRKYAVAIPDWRVSLQGHHEGYISWEEFLHNQERLEKNRTNGEETTFNCRPRFHKPKSRSATTIVGVAVPIDYRPITNAGSLHPLISSYR